MPSSHLILCRPLLLLPSVFPSIRIFSNQLALHIRWPKYWSFSFSPSNEHSGLISFRMDGLDLLAVQGTLKSLLQHHSSKASILWHSAFFMVQLSPVHDYWKNHSFGCVNLCRQIDVSDFNTLSRFITTFLPKSMCLLISWLHLQSAVVLEPEEIKSATDSTLSSSTWQEKCVYVSSQLKRKWRTWHLCRDKGCPLLYQ